MAGRALVFSNPEVLRLAKTEFIPYAGDQWYLHRRKDAVGQFFWKVAQQGLNRNRPLDSTRQGIYTATAEGECLGSINSWSAARTVAIMTQALERWKQQPHAETVEAARPAADAEYDREPPAGGLVLDVFTRIPLGSGHEWSPNSATGRDHMWLTREEWRSLLPARWRPGARYPVPPAVAERLVRFHLVDNVRGEPNMWTHDQVRQAELTLQVMDAAGHLRLEGTARVQAPFERRASERGYDARLQGFLTYDRKQSRFTRCDLLAWGEAWGRGTYTGGAPPGRFPLVIALSLAGKTPSDRIPPQAIRNRDEYWGTQQAGR